MYVCVREYVNVFYVVLQMPVSTMPFFFLACFCS